MTYTYVLVYLIKGRAKKYHLSLSRDLSKKFRIKNVGRRIEPHITLKFIGEINNYKMLRELEENIKEFTQSERGFKIRLKGINHFSKNVIFVDVRKDKALIDFYNRLYSHLRKLSWMPSVRKFEGNNMHFHATLAVDDISLKFNQIYNYISNRTPQYVLSFRSVALIRKNKSKWKTYKEFKLR